MRLPILVTMCLCLQGFCFGSEIPLLQDTPQNIEYRISVANSSLHALHALLPRIQNTIHDDPNKACDLICNAMKFLMNAEACLNNADSSTILVDTLQR
jgi:phage baseplate assembly protein W